MKSFRSSSLKSLGDLRNRASAQLKQYSPYNNAIAWLGPMDKQSTSAEPVREAEEKRTNLSGESETSRILEPSSASESLFQILHMELIMQYPPDVLEHLGDRVGSQLVILNHSWPLISDSEDLARFVQHTLWRALFGRKAEKLKRAAMSKEFDGYLVETKEFIWMRGTHFERSTAFMKGLLIGVIRELTNAPKTEPKVHIEYLQGAYRFFFGVPRRDGLDSNSVFDEHSRLYRLQIECDMKTEEQNFCASSSSSSSAGDETLESSSQSRTEPGGRQNSSGISEDLPLEISVGAEQEAQDHKTNVNSPDSCLGRWANEGFLWTEIPAKEEPGR